MNQSKLKYNISKLIFSLLCCSQVILAEVLPRDRSFVHSATIYFEENKVDKAEKYRIYICTDSTRVNENAAIIKKENIFPSFYCSAFQWGKKYFWQVIAFDSKGKKISKGALHVFTMVEEVGSPHFDSLRIEIITNKPNKHAGGFLVIDYMRGIYDRTGKPVWKVPTIDGYINVSSELRDLKFTKDNSITLLSDSRPLEIDLNGNLLWSLPSPFVFMGDTVTFHHDFEKTKRNTYLLLANKPVKRRVYDNDAAGSKKSQTVYEEKDGVKYAGTEVGVIIEMTEKAEVLWWWDAGTYLSDIDLNYKKRPDGIAQMQSHANAVGISDDDTKVFLGFRDLSRVLVIDKASKRVQISYGEKYPSGEAKWGNTLFNQQHDANPTNRNSFYVFNNNGPRGKFGVSSIYELTADSSKVENPVLWKFSLDFDTLTKGRSGSGGNVNELPNSNILLCAGQLNRLFEVTKDKEVVWDGLIYALQKSDGKWHAMPNYRSSWVDKVQVRNLYTELRGLAIPETKSLKFELRIYDALEPNDSYDIVCDKASIEKKIVHSRTKNAGELIEIKLSNIESHQVEMVIVSKSNPNVKKRLTLINKN